MKHLERIVTGVMLSHSSDNVDGFSYRWLARQIALEVAKEVELHTIERCKNKCSGIYYGYIGEKFGEVRYGISACISGINELGDGK